MPSYKTYKKSSLQEIYLCRKSIFGGNLSLEALDADKFEETNLNNVSINIIRYKYNKVYSYGKD